MRLYGSSILTKANFLAIFSDLGPPRSRLSFARIEIHPSIPRRVIGMKLTVSKIFRLSAYAQVLATIV